MNTENKILNFQYASVNEFINRNPFINRVIKIQAGFLFKIYVNWCTNNDHCPVSRNLFYRAMTHESFKKINRSGHVIFVREN